MIDPQHFISIIINYFNLNYSYCFNVMNLIIIITKIMTTLLIIIIAISEFQINQV